MITFITFILIGISLGLSNFAASIALGLGGISKSIRLRIAVIFGCFETGMPIIGLILGRNVSQLLYNSGNIVGGCLLGLTGMYLIFRTLKNNSQKEVKKVPQDLKKLLLMGFLLSIDNLIVGFGLGTLTQSLLLGVIVIGSISVVMVLLGLELGSRLGNKIEEYSEFLSGVILLIVALAIGFKIL